MPATAETKTVVAPFAIEADHYRCGDLIIQAIPGCRMRSTISASKPAKDAKTGEPRIPQDQAKFLGQFPEIPGMQIHVNPAKLTYVIIDPLDDDEDLCEKIRRTLERVSPFRVGSKLKGVPSQKGTLDVHRMKTLVRELIWWIDSNDAKVIKGTKPDMVDVERLPGKFLLNPGSRVHNTQPQFEEDWEHWVSELTKSGG